MAEEKMIFKDSCMIGTDLIVYLDDEEELPSVVYYSM
jgi:hypothetical protein